MDDVVPAATYYLSPRWSTKKWTGGDSLPRYRVRNDLRITGRPAMVALPGAPSFASRARQLRWRDFCPPLPCNCSSAPPRRTSKRQPDGLRDTASSATPCRTIASVNCHLRTPSYPGFCCPRVSGGSEHCPRVSSAKKLALECPCPGRLCVFYLRTGDDPQRAQAAAVGAVS